MKQILVLGASNSSESINKAFATWAASQLENVELYILDLNDFEMPLFGVDRQRQEGIPDEAQKFINIISASNGIVLSLAEHNGSYTSAFKNIVDWGTRIEKSMWQQKPMLLLSTAPGPRGGKSVMETASASFPRWGAQITASFSLPSFQHNFDLEKGIINADILESFMKSLRSFSESI